MKNKQPTLTFASNGFEFRAKNKRVRVVEKNEDNDFVLEFEHYIGSNHITALTTNVRGIAKTRIDISQETLMAICQGVFEHLVNKKS